MKSNIFRHKHNNNKVETYRCKPPLYKCIRCKSKKVYQNSIIRNPEGESVTVSQSFVTGDLVPITENCGYKIKASGYRIHHGNLPFKVTLSAPISILHQEYYFLPEDGILPFAPPLPPTTSVLLIVFAAFLTDDLKLPILYDMDRE